MDLQKPIQVATPVQNPAPPRAEADGRASADAAAIKKDPTPDVPLPIPANGTQTALISKSAIPTKEDAPKIVTTNTSAAERTLKPYGINMLPEKTDTPKQQTPDS